ncbi:MAG TPA: hypothetical protein DIW77_12320 [Chromatiaceae bacterium]|nr:hypothetical protein [Chromatiaceae bacterium]
MIFWCRDASQKFAQAPLLALAEVVNTTSANGNNPMPQVRFQASKDQHSVLLNRASVIRITG